jgi:hypothetical protein
MGSFVYVKTRNIDKPCKIEADDVFTSGVPGTPDYVIALMFGETLVAQFYGESVDYGYTPDLDPEKPGPEPKQGEKPQEKTAIRGMPPRRPPTKRRS